MRRPLNSSTSRARRFASDRSGAAAIEFAIVAPVFLMLMFAIFEVGWFYFVNSMVDSAATNAARILRTGQAQKVEMSSGEFFNEIVCPRVEIFGDCSSRLTVEVKKYDKFADLAADANAPLVCRDAAQSDIDDIPYDPGGESQIVRVRLCFLYDTLNPAIGMNLAQNEHGQRKVTATYVLRTEPFETTSSTADET